MKYCVSVVVPCYNSARTVQNLVSELKVVLERIADRYEVILVNDGSKDRTWNLITEVVSRESNVRGINLTKNFGQHNATLCGILAAEYELICTIDDDLQYSPEDIPVLIERLETGYDVVYGVPERRRHGLIRDTGAYVFKKLLAAIGASSSNGISSFRVLRSYLAEGLAHSTGRVVCLDVVFSWTTDKFTSIKVSHNKRVNSESSYSLLKLTKVAFDLVLAYSSLPLKFIGFSGLFCVIAGALLLVYCLFSMINGSSLPVAGAVTSVILLVGGLQLCGLGIIGEYLIRLYSSSVKQPPFQIETEIDNSACKSINGIGSAAEKTEYAVVS